MDSISEPIINTTQTTTAQKTEPATSIDSAGDFETFLTLLTAQMKNQDPMKPMDSTEFVAQLASFSSVEQQVRTNDQLSELIGLFAATPTSTMVDWIGKEVRHQGEATFDGSPVDLEVSIHPNADSAVMSVYDSFGQLVYQTPVSPTQSSHEWAGETAAGTAPTGRYSFEVESYIDGNSISTETAAVFDLVTEVRIENAGLVLVFADGSTMSPDEVTSIQLPSA